MPRDELRIGRVSLPHHVYHITTCTEARQAVFEDFACARLVVAEMRELSDSGVLTSIAWVIMPDHVHWLFQLGDSLTLSQLMKRFQGRSAQAVNQRLGRRGSLWQRGFHDHGIRQDEDLRATARYIVANPLRAGLVQRIGDYLSDPLTLA